MKKYILEFEKPIVELERKIAELTQFSKEKNINLDAQLHQLHVQLEKLTHKIFNNLSSWQKVQIARQPKRPYTLDYINKIFTNFIELHGDRRFSDDKAMISGFARLSGKKVAVIGHQKGRDTKENLMRNFGSAHPEGYRKALRVMKLAEKFHIPIICFIDTPGAYPGIGAEERGQAEAIAINIYEMFALKTPILVYIIGEGGSGGALGIGIGDKVCMLKYAYYSVISPEGCAAILWKDKAKAQEAADVLRLTAKDLLAFGIIDEIVPEPLEGAHKYPEETILNLKASLERNLANLTEISDIKSLVDMRYEKFRNIGQTLLSKKLHLSSISSA